MSSTKRDVVVYWVLLVAIVFALGVSVTRDLRADPPNGDLSELARSYLQPSQGTPQYEYFAVCRSQPHQTYDENWQLIRDWEITKGVVIELDREPGRVIGYLNGARLIFYHLGGRVYSAPITQEMLFALPDRHSKTLTVRVVVSSPVTGFENSREIVWNPDANTQKGAIIDFKEVDLPLLETNKSEDR